MANEVTDKMNRPDYRSKAYQYMAPEWEKTVEVWSGLRAMRESKNNYLIQFEKETDEKYKARKQFTEFYNVFGGTIDTAVGMVFESDIRPADAPKPLEAYFNDIDLCGNDLSMFLRSSFTNAIRDGHSGILVDAPLPVETQEGNGVTLAHVKDRRPYWINYTASQIINPITDVINGKVVLQQVTLEETVIERDGLYGEAEICQWRVLRPGTWQIFRKVTDKDEFALHSSGVTSLTEIPLTIVYGKKKRPFESTPPFMDILETNLTHYNAQSSLRTALKYIVPLTVIKVSSEEDAKKFGKMTVAVDRGVLIWGEHSEVKYLELEGKSIEALRTDIQDLELKMSKKGSEKFAPVEDGTTKTATEIGSDNRKQMSEMSVMAKNLENAAETAFYYTALYENAIRGEGTVETEKARLKIKIDYDKLIFSLEQLKFFAGEVQAGRLSNRTHLEMLASFAVMPKDWTPEEEMNRIAAEKPVVVDAVVPPPAV